MSDFAMYKKLHGVRLPLEGHLDLTYRCNNNCRHCYINLPANDKEAKGKELSLEEISAIANEAVSMGLSGVSLQVANRS